MSEETKEIDLTTIDWNQMKPEDFQELSQKMLSRKIAIKKTQERKKKEKIVLVPLIIHGETYSVPSNVVDRIKALKSKASRDKLIGEIILTQTPIQEI